MKKVMGILLALILATTIAWQITLPNPIVPLSDLKPLSLLGYKRLLVLAPHCDDETLGTGGLILEAERVGLDVRVVIATNGDGFFFATMQDFKKIYPTAMDYVHFGEIRQQESLAAMKILGLSPDQVTFLSYPDRGTPALWDENWDSNHPFRSPYSQDTKSPYPLTYNPGSVYAGQDYLHDLISIMTTYRPDLIVYPHPDDVHPDHWGLSVFSRLAITQIEHQDPFFQPTEITYLVHRPDYPEIRGLKPQDALTPPEALFTIFPDWYQLELSPEEVSLKEQAVYAYHSQLPLLRGLMESFIRINETFAVVENASPLLKIGTGNFNNPASWKNSENQPISPIQLDPVGDFATRRFIPAGDLVAVYAALNEKGELWVCSQEKDETVPEVIYLIRMKILNGSSIYTIQASTGTKKPGWYQLHRSGAFACMNYSQPLPDQSWAVFIGAATVSAGRTMDETGWQMVQVK